MKTIKKLSILIICILLVYCVHKLLIKHHEVKYKITDYTIYEKFYINKGHHYDITINNNSNKYNYSYTVNHNFNKQKKIIKNIKVYHSNSLLCLKPIYDKDISEELYCNLDNKPISLYYLVNSNNKDLEKILKKEKNIILPSTNDSKTKYKKLTVYQKNILNNYKLILWDYKGIYILDSNELKYQKVLDYDLYDNVMATISSNYYVLFENTSVSGIENVYYYDLLKNKLNEFKLSKKISKDSYINGVVDNLIYVTDRRQKKQYTINVRKKEIKLIDNEDNKYVYYNDSKKILLTKSDFFIKDQIFNSENKEYNYYYSSKDDLFYKGLNNKNKILLFEFKNVKEWQAINRDILLLSDKYIYLYNDQVGLRKIVESNELKYNHKNIYKLWKK